MIALALLATYTKINSTLAKLEKAVFHSASGDRVFDTTKEANDKFGIRDKRLDRIEAEHQKERETLEEIRVNVAKIETILERRTN